MAVRATMGSFFEDLRRVREETFRSMMRFQLTVAQNLQSEIQDNIKRTFGSDKPGRSSITRQAAGDRARTSGRGGGLFGSVQIEKISRGLAVSVGGVGVPYAAIHEYGGDIYPRSAKYLTIPFAPKFVGKRAREFDLIFNRDDEMGYVLMTRQKEIAYLLRKHVRIPERPYIRPAMDQVQKDAEVKAMLITAFRPLSLEVRVE